VTPSCLQAARKKVTLRATCGPISACKVLSFSPYGPDDQGQDDTPANEARCRRKALRSECRQFAKLVGLGRLAQKPNHCYFRTFARHPVDPWA